MYILFDNIASGGWVIYLEKTKPHCLCCNNSVKQETHNDTNTNLNITLSCFYTTLSHRIYIFKKTGVIKYNTVHCKAMLCFYRPLPHPLTTLGRGYNWRRLGYPSGPPVAVHFRSRSWKPMDGSL